MRGRQRTRSGPGKELRRRIQDRRARLGVLGLGQVGLSLALAMAKAGFGVTGIDIDRKKVESVNAGFSCVPDLPNETVLSLVGEGKLRATQALAVLRDLDAAGICVPTPLRKTKDPDLTYLVAAAEAIRNHLHSGQLIVLESATYPGATEEVLLPILEKSGLRVGEDFFLAYSHERATASGAPAGSAAVARVIGGITGECADLAALLYRQLGDRVTQVSSPGTAEMIRLVENIFSSVNTALANEVALVCQRFGIDVWEVIEAANTSNSARAVTFVPGPAAWTRSIAGDPCYLTWKAKMDGFEPRLIELAGQINSQTAIFTASRIMDALNERRKSVKGSRILVLGVAHRRDADDTRDSPAFEVLRQLRRRGALVQYSDPYVPRLELGGEVLRSVEPTPELLRSTDCVVVLLDHEGFDYGAIAAHSRLVLDGRNALKEFSGRHILRL